MTSNCKSIKTISCCQIAVSSTHDRNTFIKPCVRRWSWGIIELRTYICWQVTNAATVHELREYTKIGRYLRISETTGTIYTSNPKLLFLRTPKLYRQT